MGDGASRGWHDKRRFFDSFPPVDDIGVRYHKLLLHSWKERVAGWQRMVVHALVVVLAPFLLKMDHKAEELMSVATDPVHTSGLPSSNAEHGISPVASENITCH